MRLIRSQGTKPELRLFAILTGAGITYRPHETVDGVNVDAVIEERLLLFVDSPFWHLRDATELERLSPYWRQRLLRNRRRDRRQVRLLRSRGFTVLRFWSDRLDEDTVLSRIAKRRQARTKGAS